MAHVHNSHRHRSDVHSDRHPKRQRTRSRSPINHDNQAFRHQRRRSRSQERTHRSHHGNRYSGGKEYDLIPASAVPAGPPKPKALPFRAQPLDSHQDLEANRALFALYLSVQKQLDISELDDREVKGRWKSFVKKWNKGELAEGWYDPSVKTKADDEDEGYERIEHRTQKDRDERRAQQHVQGELDPQPPSGDASEDDEFGPSFPSNQLSTYSGDKSRHNQGPTIPNMQDLTLRSENLASDSRTSHLASQSELRSARKTENYLNKSRQEELAPRSDANSHARRLESARDRAVVQSSFQTAKEGGDVEINDGELLGGGDGDGIEEYKQKRREEEKKKTERQIRREEMERARNEERRERLKSRKDKEDRTVEMLRELARSRFGGP